MSAEVPKATENIATAEAQANLTTPAQGKDDAAVTKEEDEIVGPRVFIRNLSFKTTEEEIREHLKPAGVEVVSVVMPMRMNSKRPAGFAFASFKNDADVETVVQKLDGSVLAERKLTMAPGRSKEEQALRREAALAKRKEIQEKKEAQKLEKAARGEPVGEAEGEKTKSQKKAKKASRRRQPAEGEDEKDAETSSSSSSASGEDAKPKKGKSRNNRKGTNEARIDGESGDGKPKRAPKKEPKLKLTDKVTTDTVFVANLPYNVDDDALAAIFTNMSIKVKKAQVVLGLKFPRRGRGGPRVGRPFRGSKGFGFVEVEDPAQQEEAVTKANGTLVGDRQISVKAAQEMEPVEKETTEGSKEAEPATETV